MEDLVLYSGDMQSHTWCHDVKKYGHHKKHCNQETKITQEEVVLMAFDQSKRFTNDTWVGDIRVMSHMTNSNKGLIDVQTINKQIRVGNDKFMTATKKGLLPCTIKQANGKDQNCILEVKVIPEMWCNLFSITSAMKKGFEISSKNMVVSISKGDFKFCFDKVGETISGGFLMGVEIVP